MYPSKFIRGKKQKNMNSNSFSLEADTRMLIDTALTNLGWVLNHERSKDL